MTFQDGRHMIPYFSRLSCISLFSFQGASFEFVKTQISTEIFISAQIQVLTAVFRPNKLFS